MIPVFRLGKHAHQVENCLAYGHESDSSTIIRHVEADLSIGNPKNTVINLIEASLVGQ